MNDLTTQPPPQAPQNMGEARRLGDSVSITQSGGFLIPKFDDMRQMMDFAQLMSGAGVMVGPAVRQNPGACMAVIMIAGRFSLDPFMLSTKAYVVKNKQGVEVLAWESQAVNAMIIGSNELKEPLDYKFTGEGQDRQIEVIGKLIGSSEPRTITSSKIRDIKPKNSPLWTSDPDQQLRYYGARNWIRSHAPHVLMGIYTREELDGQVIDGKAVTVEDASQRMLRNVQDLKSGESAPLIATEGEAPSDTGPHHPVDETAQGSPPLDTDDDAIVDETPEAEPEPETTDAGETPNDGEQKASLDLGVAKADEAPADEEKPKSTRKRLGEDDAKEDDAKPKLELPKPADQMEEADWEDFTTALIADFKERGIPFRDFDKLYADELDMIDQASQVQYDRILSIGQ